jgi:4'-phosphopantetheinyl transferase
MQVEALQRDQVHVWTIERDRQVDPAQCLQLLSAAERQRAERLKFVERREAFIYYRAMLRSILASYAGIDPRAVPLGTTAEGKPVWEASARSLSFNLAHCGDLAIVAVSQQRSIGVDLESLDARTNHDALAGQTLSWREMAAYEQLPHDERPPAILRVWTRKEAFLKAVGVGLARPLAEIEVTFLPTEPPQLLATGDPCQMASQWLLESWSPQPGWYAALATPRESGALHLRFHQATSLRDWHTSRSNHETPFRGLSRFDGEEQQHVA